MNNKKILLAMIITCFVAVIVSLYLLYVHYFPLVPDATLYSLCTAGTMFDCNAVNTSAYAVLFGMPLSAWGVAFYLFFMTVIFVYNKNTNIVFIEFGMLWLAIFAVMLSIVLGLISFVKIKKFCSFCMMLWACNGVLLILTGILISKVHNGLKSGLNILHDFDMIELLKNRQFQKLLAIVSIAGIISVVSGYGVNASLQYTYTQKEKQREAKLIEDFKKDYEKYEKVSIKVDDIEPFIGTNESPVHIVVFFDFNCGACHRAVSLLHEIALKYQSKVALYLRHFPLDGTCNRFIPRKKDGTSCRASLVAYSLYGKSEYINFVLQLMQYRGSINEEVIKEAIVNVHQDWADVEKKSYSPEVRKRLENDIALGGKLDISATPTIIINNTKLRPGIPPAYILEMAIKIEMAKRQ